MPASRETVHRVMITKPVKTCTNYTNINTLQENIHYIYIKYIKQSESLSSKQRENIERTTSFTNC